MALEFAFSIAGCVLDPFRSSLSPLMVEALISGQNWLRSSSAPINFRDVMGDVEKFEKLNRGITIIFYLKKKIIYIYIYMNVYFFTY